MGADVAYDDEQPVPNAGSERLARRDQLLLKLANTRRRRIGPPALATVLAIQRPSRPTRSTR